MRRKIFAYLVTGAILVVGIGLVLATSWPIVPLELRPVPAQAGRLFIALALTMAVGLEREAHDKPAGLRTTAMVGVGACLFGLIGSLMMNDQQALSRIIQGVIAGIGFLGAGTIIKEQFHIEGLTTAAALWTAAGIGLACGLGHYGLATLGTVAVMVVLTVLRAVERVFYRDEQG